VIALLFGAAYAVTAAAAVTAWLGMAPREAAHQ
jgi:hypothetical protein